MDKAIRKYLFRYAEPEAQFAFFHLPAEKTWQHTLVIPVRQEWDHFLSTCARIRKINKDPLLLILVINDFEKHEINEALLRYFLFQSKDPTQIKKPYEPLYFIELEKNLDICLINRATKDHYFKKEEGVGLARKIGCDIALQLYHLNRVRSAFVHTTDADALLPKGYFDVKIEKEAVALTYPFKHSAAENSEGLTYENWLYHYVMGLRFAGSPYAFHTVGSTLAIRAESYAQVRGFPKRTAGEDFYILNKLRKLGEIKTPLVSPLLLSSRTSHRVPFGTGPAIQKMKDEKSSPSFYSPQAFKELKEWIKTAESYLEKPASHKTMARFIDSSSPLLLEWKTKIHLDEILARSSRPSTRIRQFHEWFDGLKTLRFIRERSNSSDQFSLASP